MLRNLCLASLPLASLLFACGSPGEIEAERFPALRETAYPDVLESMVGAPPSDIPGTPDGAGGSSMGLAGSGSLEGGSIDGAGGGASMPDESVVPAGPDEFDAPGCNVTELFARPGSQGGCTGGGGCHEAAATSPDLLSPGVVERLRSAVSVRGACNGRPMIGGGGDESYLLTKVQGNEADNRCDYPMPYLMPAALSEADRQCIVAWVNAIAAEGL